jgi:hypothetical protein
MILSRSHAILGIAFALAASVALGDEIKVVLSGADEAPPVTTAASGTGVFVINADQTVSGSVTTTGIASTVAHIHVGPPGKVGPAIIPLVRSGENGWAVPPGAKLTDAQMNSYKAGELYVNVHSKANPVGEIRAVIKP